MKRALCLVAALPWLLSACVNVKTAPIEVKPIHITVDVNIKIEKELDSFFADLDEKSTTLSKETKPEAPKS